jgi:hypothetical protein
LLTLGVCFLLKLALDSIAKPNEFFLNPHKQVWNEAIGLRYGLLPEMLVSTASRCGQELA